MQQRRPRLGDILDDYCPRERRITNHAVVAMIDDQVKQTRCTTCDADHEYKQAKVPPARRKKLEAAALSDGSEAMLRARPDADVHQDEVNPVEQVAAEAVTEEAEAEPTEGLAAAEPTAPTEPAALSDTDEPAMAAAGDDDGPVHRRLIRAQLPRPEGQVPERKLPDFTIRQPGGRGGRGEFDGNRNGQRNGGRPMRFGGGARAGGGSGQGGPRHGAGGPRHGSGSGQQRPGGGNRAGQGQRGGGRPGPGGGPGQGRGGGGRKRGR
jgi:hypothetical protein